VTRSTSRSRTDTSGQRLTEVSFEDAQRELEQIVERLEHGQAPLDEAIALWERGEELYKLCLTKLDSAQGKIEELAKRVESQRPS
jgi:exodeoxyribonuclease VII small subunit